jgi:hypothetical protein
MLFNPVSKSLRGALTGRYLPRVAVTGSSGIPIRHVPGATAQAMASAGVVTPKPSAGKIREVTLTYPASSHAQRIGEPSPPSLGGVKFTRWQRLDQSGTRVIEHHPRALWII